MVENKKNAFEKLFDTPWLHKHVDTHLIFGPLVRKSEAGLFIVCALITFEIVALLFGKKSGFIDNMSLVHLTMIISLFVSIYVVKPDGFYVAAMLWSIIKITTGIAAFMFFVGSLVKMIEGHAVSITFLLLGLIWLPSVEFIPKLTVKQKYISILRAISTAILFILVSRLG